MKPLIFNIICICLIIFSCNTIDSKDQAKEQSPTEIVSEGVNVNTLTITPELFQKQIISNGVIEAMQKSELHFNTNERLVKINIKNGQKVYQGQVLAQLNNAVIVNQLDKAKIELDKAKTKLQEEKINYGLDNQDDTTIDKTILRNLHIKSGYLEAKNALENAQLLYEQTFLKSPINGVVANIITKAGDFITSNDVFCTIINQSNMDVVFTLQESDLSIAKIGQDVNITPFSDAKTTYKGKVVEINPIVDENGLVQVKANIENTNNLLFDGMHAKVQINQPVNDAIIIPKEALVLRSNREVVFTVESGLAKWNYVKVLDENSTKYAIEDGLKLGDTIIVSGNMNLSHDAKVNASFILEQDNN